ncbi:type II toxin-antitoxin system HicB family antitoxin [Thiomonas sp.]
MGPMTLFTVLMVSVASILVGGIRFSHWWYERENKTQFDGHTVRLWLNEDGDWAVAIEDMPTVSAFGKTPTDALRDLAAAWAEVRDGFRQRGEPAPAPSHADPSPARDDIKAQIAEIVGAQTQMNERFRDHAARILDLSSRLEADRQALDDAVARVESRMDHIETRRARQPL